MPPPVDPTSAPRMTAYRGMVSPGGERLVGAATYATPQAVNLSGGWTFEITPVFFQGRMLQADQEVVGLSAASFFVSPVLTHHMRVMFGAEGGVIAARPNLDSPWVTLPRATGSVGVRMAPFFHFAPSAFVTVDAGRVGDEPFFGLSAGMSM